jgi:hypothetical protein
MPQILWAILIIFLVFALIGSPFMSPHIGWQHSYGWGPSGIGVIVVVVLLILLLRGRA